MHKVSIREKAVTLRKEGYSYPYISTATGLSKSTLSGWLTDIVYTPNSATIAAFGKARAAATKRKAEIRQENFKGIREEAARDIGKIDKRDIFMFGLGLYLGEGAKTHNGVNIANADPKVIRLAVGWFKGMGIEMHQLSPRIHVYPDSNVRQCIEFWSKSSGIPVNQFQKTYIDIRTNKKYKKTGKLPFGTLYLAVRSKGKKEHGVALFRKIQAWNEVVLSELQKRD
jgi:hypothetical protein